MRQFFITLVIIGLFSGTVVFAQSDLQSEVDNLLAGYVSDDEPGVVLLVSTNEDSAVSAAGLANLQENTSLQTDDQFRIGSITKTFIGIVMLQLQDEGILSLNDLAIDWLDDSTIAQIANSDEVTLRQLLNMTSGIPDYLATDSFFDAIDAEPDHPWAPAETLEFVYGDEALFAAGDGFEYSNTNYNMLHLIIEEATGTPLADVLEARVFSPLGMIDSYLEDPANLGANIVHGYAPEDDGSFTDITFVNDGAGMADGGIISTAADMELFALGLISGDLLSNDALAEMMETTTASKSEYGLGLDVIEGPNGGQIIGHSGSTGGFQSIMYIDLEYEIVVVGLTNNFDSEIMNFDLANEAMEIAASFE